MTFVASFAALDDFEKALDEQHLQDSFRAWLAILKREKFTSSQYLANADHDSIQRLANFLWHDKEWVEQRFIRELACCENRTLVGEVIKTLAAKGSDTTLPGAGEAAKKILNKQLQRLCLGTVNLLSVRDQQAANEVHRFIDTVRVCLATGFTEEALKLIEKVKPDMEQQLHYPEPRPVLSGTRTGNGTAYVPILAHRLILMLGGLQDAYTAPFVESLRDLFEYLLRKYVLGALSMNRNRSRLLKDLLEERFRGILGDHLYRELILLEVPPMNYGHANQVIAGIKREAEEELSPPSRSGLSRWVA